MSTTSVHSRNHLQGPTSNLPRSTPINVMVMHTQSSVSCVSLVCVTSRVFAAENYVCAIESHMSCDTLLAGPIAVPWAVHIPYCYLNVVFFTSHTIRSSRSTNKRTVYSYRLTR